MQVVVQEVIDLERGRGSGRSDQHLSGRVRVVSGAEGLAGESHSMLADEVILVERLAVPDECYPG